jgi:hypothetical protein
MNRRCADSIMAEGENGKLHEAVRGQAKATVVFKFDFGDAVASAQSSALGDGQVGEGGFEAPACLSVQLHLAIHLAEPDDPHSW